ncbi:hypothetical protein E2C01_056007 [Portunus trituberculatus]|uniref:Uncharacterized protein n=1 Tax=Portunus trituberculatus TaxID=210409 RepID=A0A5B7GP83_PORTR|nr:hypothetical protein [Portunus trituberculatus]
MTGKKIVRVASGSLVAQPAAPSSLLHPPARLPLSCPPWWPAHSLPPLHHKSAGWVGRRFTHPGQPVPARRDVKLRCVRVTGLGGGQATLATSPPSPTRGSHPRTSVARNCHTFAKAAPPLAWVGQAGEGGREALSRRLPGNPVTLAPLPSHNTPSHTTHRILTSQSKTVWHQVTRGADYLL